MDKKNHIPQKESPPVLHKKNVRSRFSLRMADKGQTRRVEAALEVLIEALVKQEMAKLRVGRTPSLPAEDRKKSNNIAQINGGNHS